jgi:hypothetical protein
VLPLEQCEFDSSNEQKNEINHFNLSLAEKVSVSKMTEQAPESTLAYIPLATIIQFAIKRR